MCSTHRMCCNTILLSQCTLHIVTSRDAYKECSRIMLKFSLIVSGNSKPLCDLYQHIILREGPPLCTQCMLIYADLKEPTVGSALELFHQPVRLVTSNGDCCQDNHVLTKEGTPDHLCEALTEEFHFTNLIDNEQL